MPRNSVRGAILALSCVVSSAFAAAESPARRAGTLTRESRLVTTQKGVQVTVEAGTFAVPENRDRPTDRVFELPYYRLRSTSPRPATAIFLLAGGPGSSWIERFESEEDFAQVQYYRTIADVVLFDQRGGGRSQPPVTCEGIERQRLPLDQPLDLERAGAEMRRLSALCRDRVLASGVDLGGLTTVQNAADVDALRAALGYEKMTLIGGSYGSHLALAVMRQFPRSVERVVLFGVEGPDHTWDDPAGQLATLGRIAAAVEASPAFRTRIPEKGLLAALRTVIQRLEAKPVTVTLARDGKEVSVVVDAAVVRRRASFQAGRRSRSTEWPNMILDMYRGDYSRMAQAAIEMRMLRVPPDAPMHSMMDCSSGVSPERAARQAKDPATDILGDINFEYRAVCGAWSAPDLGPSFRAPVVSALPALILHGTWDTSTPLENAREVASTLSNAQLVEVVEGGHGAIYNLFERWPPMRSQLALFLRGETVRFPSQVTLEPAVSFEAPPVDK